MYNSKFLNAFLNDAQDFFEAFDEAIASDFNEKNNDNKNYYHFISNKYENGKCIDHEEKIIDNGKVVKDEHKTIGDKKDETKSIESKIIKDKNKEIEDLKSEIRKLNEENDRLTSKISQIKKLFN